GGGKQVAIGFGNENAVTKIAGLGFKQVAKLQQGDIGGNYANKTVVGIEQGGGNADAKPLEQVALVIGAVAIDRIPAYAFAVNGLLIPDGVPGIEILVAAHIVVAGFVVLS